MTPRLRVEGASVRFGATAALDDLDVEVAVGEVVAVLGPSGCGKSTMLRAVAGLQPLTAGRVELDGLDQTGVGPHLRDVGLMFQDHALFPHRDVAANVGFGLRMRGTPGDAIGRRVDELLELVGLPGTGRRAVTTLSGGEQQRVALARALAPSPRLLMLDEPLGSLDRALRERLVGDLRRLFTTLALSVVAVTHDQAEAFTLADRLVVMGAGRVLREGSPADVWARPGTAEVAVSLGFTNVAAVDVASGVAHTPWGDVAVAAADGHRMVLVRPGAVRLGRPDEQAGGRAGVVASVGFGGERSSVEVTFGPAPPLTADVATAEAPAAGTRVTVELEPAGVSVLDG